MRLDLRIRLHYSQAQFLQRPRRWRRVSAWIRAPHFKKRHTSSAASVIRVNCAKSHSFRVLLLHTFCAVRQAFECFSFSASVQQLVNYNKQTPSSSTASPGHREEQQLLHQPSPKSGVSSVFQFFFANSRTSRCINFKQPLLEHTISD